MNSHPKHPSLSIAPWAIDLIGRRLRLTGSTQDYRLTDISNYSSGTTVLSKFDYSYTPAGDISTEQEQTDSNTPTLWTYGYDKADQLLSATRTNTSTSAVLSQYIYGYDLAGNRTSNQVGLSVTASSFNVDNETTTNSAGGPLQFTGTLNKPGTVSVNGQATTMDRTYTQFSGTANVTGTNNVPTTNNVPVVATSVNGYAATNTYLVVVPPANAVTSTYDNDGNLLNNGNGQAYTWDDENELTAITYSSGPNAGNHTEFTYDALGRRIAIVEREGTTIGSGTVTSTKQFVWIGDTMAEQRDASNSVTARFYAQGEQIGGTNYYYTRDQLGSVREMCDGSGNIAARYDYDPNGNPTLVSGTNLADFQYAGMYDHQTSGLDLTLFRAYDPSTARWLSRDPIGENVGINLYEYAYNNPIMWIDCLGLTPGVQWSSSVQTDSVENNAEDFGSEAAQAVADGTGPQDIASAVNWALPPGVPGVNATAGNDFEASLGPDSPAIESIVDSPGWQYVPNSHADSSFQYELADGDVIKVYIHDHDAGNQDTAAIEAPTDNLDHYIDAAWQGLGNQAIAVSHALKYLASIGC